MVGLKNVTVGDAVTRVHEALGEEISNVLILGNERTNQIVISHRDGRTAELLERFFLAIDLPEKPVGITIVSLQYIPAAEALEALHKALGEEMAEARAVLCERSNRILIGGTEAGRRRIEAFLVALDRQPPQIQIRTVLTKVEKDEMGREVRTVLSQPTVTVQSGKPGVIMTSTGGGSSLELELVATIVDLEGPRTDGN